MKSLIDFDYKSSFKYQIIFSMSAFIHIVFFFLFIFCGAYLLAVFNTISICFYAISTIVGRKNAIERHGIGWIVAVYLEITAHSILCTLWLGFESCFFMYSMVVLIVTTYVLYLAYDRRKFLRIILPFAAVTFALLIGTFLFLIFSPPIFSGVFGKELTNVQLLIMRGINIFFNTFIIFFFSITFIAEMNVLLNKLNEVNEQLNFSADHDALTGLYNRRSFYRLFDELFVEDNCREETEEDGSLLPNSDKKGFCVIMGDIDNFKKINDTYGHGCGDEILKNVSEIIKESITEKDIACRWGGEEFLIVMSGERDGCFERIEEIRMKVGDMSIVSSDTVVSVTMTFGFTTCFDGKAGVINQKITNIDELVQIADDRLYLGKNCGKNIVVA